MYIECLHHHYRITLGRNSKYYSTSSLSSFCLPSLHSAIFNIVSLHVIILHTVLLVELHAVCHAVGTCHAFLKYFSSSQSDRHFEEAALFLSPSNSIAFPSKKHLDIVSINTMKTDYLQT